MVLIRQNEKNYTIEQTPWKLNGSTIDSQQTNLIKLSLNGIKQHDVHIYTHMHVCVYIYTHMHDMYTHTHTHTHIYISTETFHGLSYSAMSVTLYMLNNILSNNNISSINTY